MLGSPVVPFTFPSGDGSAGCPLVAAGSRALAWGQDLRSTASPTFAGLTLSGLTAGTLLTANGSKALTSLANAAGYLYNDGAGAFSYVATPAPAAHDLLSASHGDALSGTVVRGDLLVGNSTPKWSRKAKGSAGQLVTFDANDVAYTTATYPATTTAYQILHSTAANTVGGSGNLTFDAAKGLYIGGNIGLGTSVYTIGAAGNEYQINAYHVWTDTTASASKVTLYGSTDWNPTGTSITQYVTGLVFSVSSLNTCTTNNPGTLAGITGSAFWRSSGTLGHLRGITAAAGTYNGGSDSSGTVTDLIVLSVLGYKTASSTITTAYGINISGVAGTTAYDLYASDAAAKNYFAGGIGAGVTSPTARLHLGAGSTSASSAPLKINSGNLMTTAEDGAIERLTDKVYFTINTDTARKEITLNDAALTSGKTPVATTNGRLTDGLILSQGTYTPTATGVTNVDSATGTVCQYLRVGNVVTVSGYVLTNPTSASTTTRVGLSLPVASDFTSTEQCAGCAGSSYQEEGYVTADTTNDRADLFFYAKDTAEHKIQFHFTYLIA